MVPNGRGALVLLCSPVVALLTAVCAISVRAALRAGPKLLQTQPAEVVLALLARHMVTAARLRDADAAAGAWSAVFLEVLLCQAGDVRYLCPSPSHSA